MELSRSMYGCLVGFLVVQCVRYSSMNSYTHLQWNTCGTSDRRTVMGSNLTECIRFCAMRGYCVSVSYNRKYGVCKLYDSVDIQSQKCLGYVFVLKEHFKLQEAVFPSCIHPVCVPNMELRVAETNKYREMNCLPDQVSEDTCVYRECGHIPKVQGAETFGNMMHVGAKVMYVCEDDGSESYIECGEDGNWSSLPECLIGVVTIGELCKDDSDCHDIHSRCLAPSKFSLDDKRCYCNVMYEYNDQARACVQECVSYSKNYTERPSSKVFKHSIDAKPGIRTPDKCAEFCFNDYDNECPAFKFIFGSGWCKCLYVTFQQVKTSNPRYSESNTQNNISKMYDRICMN